MSTYHFNHFKFWVRQVELLQVHRQDWVDPSDLTSVHSIIYFWRQCWSATKRKNNSQFKLALQLIRSTLPEKVNAQQCSDSTSIAEQLVCQPAQETR